MGNPITLFFPSFIYWTNHMKTVDKAKKDNTMFIEATCHEVSGVIDGGGVQLFVKVTYLLIGNYLLKQLRI